MSKIAEEMNTYMKMVSGPELSIATVDNIVEKQSHQSVHDVLQDHPKEVALFKRSPEQFNLHKHPEFYKDLEAVYKNEMPHEGDSYDWIHHALMDEILGRDDEPEEIGKDAPYDDFDQDLEYDDDNDWGGFDNFESKLMKEDSAKSILAKHPEDVKKAYQTGEIEYNSDLYTELFYYYQDEMPYGTQKARDGDPSEYIHLALADDGIVFDENIEEEVGDVYSTVTDDGEMSHTTMHGLLDQIEDYYHNKTGNDNHDVQIGDDDVYIGNDHFSIEKNGEDLGNDLYNELEREDISKGRGPYQHKLQGDNLEKSKTMTPDEIKRLAGI